MNVTYIARFFWPTIGGGGIVTTELAKRLCNHGCNVTLLVPSYTHEHMRAQRAKPVLVDGLTVCYCGPRLSRFPADTLSFIFVLLRAIPIALRSHVILGQHHHSCLAALCAAIVSSVTRRPLIIRVDDLVAKPSNNVQRALAFILGLATSWALRHARKVFVAGDELVEKVQAMYALNEQVAGVSYNGVDTERFRPTNRSEDLRRTLGSKHIVVFSGVISPDRGVEVLLRATPIIRVRLPDVKVLVIGDGSDLQRLKRLANSLDLGKSVEFLGTVDQSLLANYLASADVGIGPLLATIQTYGVTPLKVLEYMASGCVVVTGTDTLSSKLIIDGKNGLFAKSDNAADLAKKILEVFRNDRLAKKLRENARKTVEEVYEWETVTSQLETSLRLFALAERST